jgi:hypothetical protein
MDTVTVGGKEVQVRLREMVCMNIARKFNRIQSTSSQIRRKNMSVAKIKEMFEESRDDMKKLFDAGGMNEQEYQERYRASIRAENIQIKATRIIIPDVFYYWAVWKVMVKRGIWPFRSPFRSFRHMRKEIERGEAIAVIQFINEKIFGYKTILDDDSKKKD